MIRAISIVLILCISLGGLYLMVRQNTIESVKISSYRASEAEQQNLQRMVREWQGELQNLARQRFATNLVLRQSNRKAPAKEIRVLEQIYREYIGLRKEYIKSIRLIDRFGIERIVVDQNGASRNYLNVSRETFFRKTMSLRPFEPAGSLNAKKDAESILNYSINFASNGLVIGVITIGIDLAKITDTFSTIGDNIAFNHVYIFNDKSNLVYDQELKVSSTVRDAKEVRQVLSKIKDSTLQLPVYETLSTLWTFLDSQELGFSILLEMEDTFLHKKVLKSFLPIGSLFLVSSLLLLGMKRKRRRYSKKGGMLVSDDKKKAKRKNIDDTGVRLNDLSNISNEIRTPLNSVLGMLSLLRVSRLDKKQSEYLDLATKYSEWILELLNEITDFSALKKGKLRLDNIDFDIRHTVKDVTDILSVEAYKKGLEIYQLVNAQVPERIIGDPTRLRQILVNLVGNAIKFTEQGDIAINVTTEKQKGYDVTLRIEVSDTGIGIDDDIRHTIFTEFEKTEIIPEGDNTGTGLGLSISKQLVEIMGGEIGFKENALGGSTFWLTMPYQLAYQRDQLTSMGKLNGLHALMLGENGGNRKTIASTLGNWGMSCDTNGEFETTVDQLCRAKEQERPYDILILDISVSSSSNKAFDIVKQLKETPSVADTRTLLITAQGVVGDATKAKELNIDAYLTKPINRTQLRDALHQVSNTITRKADQLITKHSINEVSNSGPSLLVVESSPTNQKLIAGFLSRLGVHADFAGSGKEAIKSVKERPYGMVLMNHILPEMDVLETVGKIRKYEQSLMNQEDSERAFRTPIVLVVSSIKDKEKTSCEKVGVDGFINKPLKMESVTSLLVDWNVLDNAHVYKLTQVQQ